MRYVFLFTLLMCCQLSTCFADLVVTNRRGHGRLGDQLMMVAKGYWTAYKYQVDYLPIVKPNASKFHLKKSRLTPPINSVGVDDIAQARWLTHIRNILRINIASKHPSWESPYEVGSWKGLIDNPEFLDHFRALLALNCPKELARPPEDCLSIAVHIRRGGGYDLPLYSQQLYTLPDHIPPENRHFIRFRGPPCIDLGEPLKFPPLQYYVNSLKTLAKQYNNTPLYIRIFTDDLDPRSLVKTLKNATNLTNATWESREFDNGPDRNILFDLFSMPNFDCLIRSGSHFCQIAHLLGDYRAVIYPTTYFWYNDDILVMDDIEVVIDGNYTFPHFNHRCEPVHRWPQGATHIGAKLLTKG